jgi:hypothetical protein
VSVHAADNAIVSSLRKVASIVGAFMVVGPPAGCFFFLVTAVTVGEILQGSPFYKVLFLILASVLLVISGIPFSYVYGIVPAAIAGLLIGMLQLKYGGLNWPLVLATGICVGAGYSLALGHLPSARPLTKLSAPDYAIHGLACVFATFVCWRFVRNWYPAKAAS